MNILKVIDYKLVMASSLNDLSNQVKDLLRAGWEPLGAAFCENHYKYQTMILREVRYNEQGV